MQLRMRASAVLVSFLRTLVNVLIFRTQHQSRPGLFNQAAAAPATAVLNVVFILGSYPSARESSRPATLLSVLQELGFVLPHNWLLQ